MPPRETAIAAIAEAKAAAQEKDGAADGRLAQLTKRYAARFRRQRQSQTSKGATDDDVFSMADLEMQLLASDDDDDQDDNDDSDSDSDSSTNSGGDGADGSPKSGATRRGSDDQGRPGRRTSVSVVRPGDKSEVERLDAITPRPLAAIDAIESTNQAFNLAQEEVRVGAARGASWP